MLNKYDDANPVNRVPMTWKFVWSHPAHWLATWFGAGAVKGAPGTYGSLAAALMFIILSPNISPAGWVWLSVILFFVGAWASERVARDLGVADHGGIVIDEVVAMWLLYAFLPQGALWWIGGFIAFRFFDIIKLPPVDMIDERMKNGWGVMADDLVAAFYAWIAVSVLGWLFG